MKTVAELREEAMRLMDDETRHLSRAELRELLEEIITDAEARLDCLDEEEGED